TLEEQEKGMRMTRQWTGRRLAALALALCAWLSPRGAQADGMTGPSVTTTTNNTTPSTGFSYKTTTNSLNGAGVVRYVPPSGGPIASPTNIGLGWFEFDPLPTNSQVNFDPTPFSLTFTPTQVAGLDPPAGQQGITLTGFLNGSIFGPNGNLPASSQAVA